MSLRKIFTIGQRPIDDRKLKRKSPTYGIRPFPMYNADYSEERGVAFLDHNRHTAQPVDIHQK